jgi:hypothetical protein
MTSPDGPPEPAAARGAAREPAATAPGAPVAPAPGAQAAARGESAGEPVLPEQSPEDTDAAWGEYPPRDDDRLYRDRPPHWDDF